MVGCVEAQKRQEMLVASGCTPKQIKAVTKQVAQLNQDRWQASELLFGDAWLFRAPRHSDNGELLAMLGQPECHGSELSAANWHSAEACARELAQSLRVQVETLYSPSSSEVGEAKRGHRRVGGSGSGSGDVHGGEGHSEVLSRGREDKGACKYRYQDEGEETGEEAGEEAVAHPMIPGGDVDFAFATGYGQVQILVRLTQPWVRPAFTAVSPTSSRATGSNTPAGGGSQDL